MAILFIAIFNSILGLSLLFPILAPLGRQLGLSEIEVGSLSTVYALMQFIVSPAWGRRSERVGRKPVLLTGVFGFAVSFFMFAVVAQLGLRKMIAHPVLLVLLVLSRAIGGTFSSATLPTAQAYVADVTDRADRTSGMAIIGAAFGLGVIFGPAIGGTLATIDLLAPVYFSAGLAVLNGIFIAARLREPPRSVRPTRPPDLRPVVAKVWPLLAIAITLSLASVAMEQTVAFYFQDRLQLSAKSTAQTVGLALVFYGVVAVVAQGFVVRRFRLAPMALIGGGLPCAFAGFLGLVFSHHFATMTAALALQGLGHGLALPGVTSAASLGVRDDEQGAVAGLNSSAQAFGRLLGPVVGTGLYQIRPEYPYYFSSVLLALVMGLLLVSPRLRTAVRA